MDGYRQHLDELAAAARGIARHKGVARVEAEVVFIIDVSRSMYPMYQGRVVQELATCLLAMGLLFDDDGVIPAYAFGERCRHLGDLTIDDFKGYVDREVIRTGADYQAACCFAPAIHEVGRYFFPEDWDRPARRATVGRLVKKQRVIYPGLSAPRANPVFAIFVTSGDCDDPEATADAIRRSSHLPIFWQFVGLSPPRGPGAAFRFLRRLDRLGNTHVDNCGFFQARDVWDPLSLFDGLLNEFPDYLALPEVKPMLKPPEQGGRTTHGTRRVPGGRAAPEDEVLSRAQSDTARRALAPKRGARGSEDHEARQRADSSPRHDEHSIAALRAKLADIQWVESTHPGGAPRSAVARPSEDVDEEPRARPRRQRRARPSDLAAASKPSSEDKKAALKKRMAALRSRLSGMQAQGDDEDADATLQGTEPERIAAIRKRLEDIEDDEATLQGDR